MAGVDKQDTGIMSAAKGKGIARNVSEVTTAVTTEVGDFSNAAHSSSTSGGTTIDASTSTSRPTAPNGGASEAVGMSANSLGKGSNRDTDEAVSSGSKKSSRGRRSSRSTKFQGSAAEVSNIDDDDDEHSADEDPPASSEERKKSPVAHHSSPRRRMKTMAPVYNEASSSESDSGSGGDENREDDEEEEDELKIERIIASQRLTIKRWREICHKINTSEIEEGSRWVQEENEELGDDVLEERFLIKWKDLSYLHCSWETERDLLKLVNRSKPYFTTFNRKKIDGCIFDEEERGDGEFFDDNLIKIDRILETTDAPDLSETDHNGDDGDANRDQNEDVDDGVKCHLDMDGAADDSNADLFKRGIILNHKDALYEDGTGRQFLIKWAGSSYSQCTYEFERDLILNDVEYECHIEALVSRSKKPSKSEMKDIDQKREGRRRRLYKIFGDKAVVTATVKEGLVKDYQKALLEQEFGNGNKLRDYQSEGVAWLMSNYINGRSSVLADEMGLGKTIMVASFIKMLSEESAVRGPFLIVAPLSTIPHWMREFSNWTDLNTFVYHGSADDRAVCREYEMPFECDRPKDTANTNNFLRRCFASRSRGKKATEKWGRTWMAQVVITTPEMLVTEDYTELTAVQWEMLVVDEAHRMKNHDSKFSGNIRETKFSFAHKVLMTGTPIQNDMKELWTILHMVDPEIFDDADSFLQEFGDMKNKEAIDELHGKIRPYMLRRLKEDVEKSVPPKEETVIEVEMTVLQKQYYRALYEKNVRFLHKGRKRSLDKPSLANLGMQLRKCCNHPFLLNGVEDELRRTDPTASSSELDFLVKASGKLILLDKLLPKLRDDGHRVLVFSQFKIMLDILEDYFRHRGMKYERIDGSITGAKRQKAIDRFQAEEVGNKDNPFVMMLSTRAGGVGITLTAADTCIIYDSDWNPQNDLQAQSRCHRIGQTKNVKIYRLISRKTFEMKMFHMASLKMGLDEAVLHGLESGSFGSSSAMTKDEVEKLLRHGAYDIFNEEKSGVSERESKDFESESIESILKRRAKTVVHENTGSKSSAAGGTFSKASFKPVHDTNKGTVDDVDIDDPDFWTKVVGEGSGPVEDQVEDLSGKKRKRKQARYSEFFNDSTVAASSKIEDDDSDSSADVCDSDHHSGDDSLEDASPVDLTEVQDSLKQRPQGKSSLLGAMAVGAKAKNKTGKAKASGKKKKPTQVEPMQNKIFQIVQGIRIPYEMRGKIRLFQSGPKTLVLYQLERFLKIGDEIIGVNGTHVRARGKEFIDSLLKMRPGCAVSLDVVRPIISNGPQPKGRTNTHASSAPIVAQSLPKPPLNNCNQGTVTTAAKASKPAFSTNGGATKRNGSSQPPPVESIRPNVLDIAIRRSTAHPTYGISVASNMGRHVVRCLETGGAAAFSGTLQIGDEITSVNGSNVSGLDWRAALRMFHSTVQGQPLQIGILRHWNACVQQSANVRTNAPSCAPLQAASTFTEVSGGGPLSEVASAINGDFIKGIRLRRDPDTQAFGIDMKWVKDKDSKEKGSVILVKLKSGTPADLDGSLKVEDEIISVNGKSIVGSGWTFRKALEEMKKTPLGQDLVVDVFRPRYSRQNVSTGDSLLVRKNLTPSNDPSVMPQRKNVVDIASADESDSEQDDGFESTEATSRPFSIKGHIAEGVKISRKSDEQKAPFGMELTFKNEFAEVQKVHEGGLIEREGTIQPGDYIISVNGKSMKASGLKLSDVSNAIKMTPPSMDLILDILRPATMESLDEDCYTILKGVSIERNSGEASFGVILQSNKEDSDDDGYQKQLEREFIYINGLKEDGAAMREGSIKRFDEILAINGTELSEHNVCFKETLNLVRSTKTGQPLLLDVIRRGPGVTKKRPPAPTKTHELSQKRPRLSLENNASEVKSKEKSNSPVGILGSEKILLSGDKTIANNRGAHGNKANTEQASVGVSTSKPTTTASVAPSSTSPAAGLSSASLTSHVATPIAQKARAGRDKNSSAKRGGNASLCSVDGCSKTRQFGTEGMCLQHWRAQTRDKATKSGKTYVTTRIAKMFEDGLFYGTIISYSEGADDEENPSLWHIRYDDNDSEDFEVFDLVDAVLLYNRKNSGDTNKLSTSK